jgi:hypothetical protein
MSEEQNQNEVVKPSFTLDDIKNIASQNEDVQKWLQSEKDSHFSKGLETWKQNNLSSLVDQEVKKLYPEETPEQQKIRELTAKFEQLEQEKQKETVRNQAYKVANEKGLPLELLDFFVTNDAEKTIENLSVLEQVFSQAVQKQVEQTFKSNGREPHKNTQSSQQINNPFKPETFNLTEQTRLYKENPELAEQLKKQAGN